jgi:hypothetical protein
MNRNTTDWSLIGVTGLMAMTVVLLVALAFVLPAFAAPAAAVEKVAVKYFVCHADGQSGTTKFSYLELPYEATFGQAGHFNEDGTPAAGHEDDFLTVEGDNGKNGDAVECDGVVTPPTNTPTATFTSTPTNTPDPDVTPTATSEVPQPTSTPGAPEDTPKGGAADALAPGVVALAGTALAGLAYAFRRRD